MKRLEFTASRIMPEYFANPPAGITVTDSGERTTGMTEQVITWANFVITIASGVTIKVASDFIYNAIKNAAKSPPKALP